MCQNKIFRLCADVKFEHKLLYSDRQQIESEVCPVDAGSKAEHSRYQRWVRPLRVIGPVRPLTDVEWTVYGDMLVPREIALAFQSVEFSGFKVRPVELFTTTETPIGREVFEVQIAGWGGHAPLESGIRVLTECPVCKRRVYTGFSDSTKLFNFDSWDGSDFFVIWPMPRYIFVTGRVREYMLKERFTGVRFEPIDKLVPSGLGRLASSSSRFSPGHLRDWFDKDRVEQIRKEARRAGFIP